MKRLFLLTMIVAVALIVVAGCSSSSSSASAPKAPSYTIQPLENDSTLLVVDLEWHCNIADAKKALNDIAAHYGHIVGTPSSYCACTSMENPTTHLFVRIEPFNPPRAMVGSAPYPNPDAPSRAGAK